MLFVTMAEKTHPALSPASSKEAAFLLARAALMLGPFPQGDEPRSRTDSVLGMGEASFTVCSNSCRLGSPVWLLVTAPEGPELEDGVEERGHVWKLKGKRWM